VRNLSCQISRRVKLNPPSKECHKKSFRQKLVMRKMMMLKTKDVKTIETNKEAKPTR